MLGYATFQGKRWKILATRCNSGQWEVLLSPLDNGWARWISTDRVVREVE